MGVGGGETKTIGYACRTVALKVFGRGFNSRRLHHSTRGKMLDELLPRSLMAGHTN